MKTKRRAISLSNSIAIIVGAATLLVGAIAIFAEIATPEIRCWLGLDDCKFKVASDKVLIEVPIEALQQDDSQHISAPPRIIILQNDESKFLERYQVSIGLKFNVFDGESLASLTISPVKGAKVNKPILNGYNLTYQSSGNSYEITIININYESQTVNLSIN